MACFLSSCCMTDNGLLSLKRINSGFFRKRITNQLKETLFCKGLDQFQSGFFFALLMHFGHFFFYVDIIKPRMKKYRPSQKIILFEPVFSLSLDHFAVQLILRIEKPISCQNQVMRSSRDSMLYPIPYRLCHVIYYHDDKKYPCLVEIGLSYILHI